MSETFNSECAICGNKEIDDVLVFRKVDQQFDTFRKYYCLKHAKKLENYLNGKITLLEFIQD